MIDRVHIAELEPGKEATIAGFVDKTRIQAHVSFVDLADHSGIVQTVYASDFDNYSDALMQRIGSLTRGSAVELHGEVIERQMPKKPAMIERARSVGKLLDREVRIDDLTIHSLAESNYPITAETEINTRLDWRFLDLRERKNALSFSVQTTLLAGMREFFLQKGWTEQFTPKLVGTPSEGGSEVFRLDYFGREAFLAQSPQFYKQMAIAAGFDGYFEIGAAYRAENSNTAHHATEFTSIDAEFPWISDHHDVMDAEEALIRHSLGGVISKHGADIKSTFGEDNVLQDSPFPRITLEEARKIAFDHGVFIPQDTADLNREAEKVVSEVLKERTGSDFVFVTEYPSTVRPFYHMRVEGRPGLTKSFDLLCKGVEITTGAQREHRYDVLVAQAREKGLSEEYINTHLHTSYLNYFRFGMPPHGGFGLGLARLMGKITGQNNIKETAFLFRGPNRLNP